MSKLRLSKKTALLSLAIALILASGVFAYTKFAADKPPADPSINLGPPTEEEKKAGDNQKEEIVEEDKEEKDTKPPANANVVISDASQYGSTIEVRAFISNVYEEGACTAVFTKGSSTFQKEVEAIKEASNTLCKPINVPRSEFPSAGAWNIVVKYSSTSSVGEAKGTLEVK